MQITEQEIFAALGRTVAIFTVNHVGNGLRFTEITDTPGHLWKCDTEDEAKGKLLDQIAKRAGDCRSITFRVWPEAGSRPDGKCSAYTRAAFT